MNEKEFRVVWASRHQILPKQIDYLRSFASRRGAELVLETCVRDQPNAKWLYAHVLSRFRPHVVAAVINLESVMELLRLSSRLGYEVWRPSMVLLHSGCGGKCANFDPAADVISVVRSYIDDELLTLHYRFHSFHRLREIIVKREDLDGEA